MSSVYEYKGRWRAQVRMKGRPAVSMLFASEREARDWADEAEKKVERREHVGKLKLSLRGLFGRYTREIAPLHKGERWEKLRLERLARTLRFVDADLTEVTADTWREWRDARLKQVSASSVNREMNLISSVYTYAIKEWGIKLPANPIYNVKRPPRGRPRTRRVSDGEINALWAASGASKTAPPRYQREYVPWMVEFGVETAMRMGEMVDLRWPDVHLEENWLLARDTKNGTSREVALTPRAVEILQMMPRKDSVFARNEGTVGVVFRGMVKDAGLKGLHFHDSRREGATRLSAHFDVLELAAQTGHKDVNTLRRVYYAPKGSELAKKLR